MLRIHRAERTDALVHALGQLLASGPADPFTPEVVAVPTKGMERWVSQRLSHLLGCDPQAGDGVCANVLFPSPSDLVARVISTVAGEEPDGSPWSPQRLRWSLLEVIDADRAAPGLAPLATYLAGASKGGERRLLAASKLADAFSRYGADRPGMLVDWAGGRDTDGAGGVLDHDLAWQAELYRRVRATIGTLSPAEQLEAICAAIRAAPESVDLPERVCVLGPTRLNVADLAVLAALSTDRDVHLWLPHPSPGMWDRVPAADADGTLRSRADTSTVDSIAVPLLAGLGRDSLELQLRLAALDEARTDEHHPLGERPASLLGALQRTLASDSAVPIPGIGTMDRSIQVHACHGPSRQVEVLREVIAGLLADDPTLEPRDVVVMVPDIEQFAPLISATFGLGDVPGDTGRAGPGHPGQQLRVQLADRSLRQTNPVLGVAAELLDLVDGRLTASEVLDLACTDPVRRRFGFGDGDLERMRTWITGTGIRWGLDATHRGRAGVPDVRENTWRTGLDRLLLGVAMSEDDQPTVGGVLPYDDVGSQDIELVGRVAEYVDRLDAAVGSLLGEQPLTAWMHALSTSLDSLTAVRPVDQWQDLAARRELGAVVVDAGSRAGTIPLAIGDVRALLADRLAGRPTRANFRTGDVTVCSLVPMRAVPHRVVCILGLDDAAFPRAGHPDGDDVLGRDPLVGERDVRSEDRQILLDAIHAATETLVLLYTGADPRTNAHRPPCVPLGELLDTLTGLTGDPQHGRDREAARRRFVTSHPLQPFDARNFVSGALGVDRPFSFDRHALAGASRAAETRIPAPGVHDLRLPSVPHEPGEDLELDELVRFVEQPVKAFLRRRLGVSVGSDEVNDVEDMLCVELNDLQVWGVANRLLQARLAGIDASSAAVAERARGMLPPGRAGDDLLAGRLHLVEGIVTAFAARSLPAASTVDVAAPVRLRTVVGSVPGVRGVTVTRVVVSSLSSKHRLRAWLHLLVLTASQPDRSWQSLVIGRRKDEVETFMIGPISRQVALTSLERLIGLYDDGMAAPLPLAPKTAEAYARRRAKGSRPPAAQTAARREWEASRYSFGEASDPAHVLVWGPDAPFEALLECSLPGIDVAEEGHTFGALSRLVWDDLLAAEGGDP